MSVLWMIICFWAGGLIGFFAATLMIMTGRASRELEDMERTLRGPRD
jgi:hypothetical protein